jgi:hypothetical protein
MCATQGAKRGAGDCDDLNSRGAHDGGTLLRGPGRTGFRPQDRGPPSIVRLPHHRTRTLSTASPAPSSGCLPRTCGCSPPAAISKRGSTASPSASTWSRLPRSARQARRAPCRRRPRSARTPGRRCRRCPTARSGRADVGPAAAVAITRPNRTATREPVPSSAGRAARPAEEGERAAKTDNTCWAPR